MAMVPRKEPESEEGSSRRGTRQGELLSSLVAGDRRAAERLVDETYELVYASLFRLSGGNADLSADLAQETYRRAWRSLASFDGRSQFSTWLYRIAYNAFLNHIRRPARFQPLEDEPANQVADPMPCQDELLDRKEVSQRLRRAVVGLPEDLRFVVTARFWGELPVREIAEIEGVTPVAIRKRLKRGVTALRLALEEDAS